jgi:ADP-ribose pyrophosphatase YjhB (NUDIX family)
VREVAEETGLEVTPNVLFGVFGGKGFRYTYANGDQVEYTVVVFGCAVIGKARGALDGETKMLRYFDPDEMPTLALDYPRSIFLK